MASKPTHCSKLKAIFALHTTNWWVWALSEGYVYSNRIVTRTVMIINNKHPGAS